MIKHIPGSKIRAMVGVLSNVETLFGNSPKFNDNYVEYTSPGMIMFFIMDPFCQFNIKVTKEGISYPVMDHAQSYSSVFRMALERWIERFGR